MDGGRHPGGVGPLDAGPADEAVATLERQSRVRHDLRAPLAVLVPLVSLMLESGDPLTERQRKQLETLERNIERLDGLITSVADSGWFDCCAAPSVPVSLPLGEAVNDLLAGRRIAVDEGPPVELRVAQDVAPALADRDQVLQIVADLIGNAAQYASGGGPVVVSVEPGPGGATVELRVTDAGPGVAADELPLLTECGYRGAAARELEVPGLGLGLWVSRRLAERNGGELRIESEPGAGTSVTVTLPAAW